jgi:hypothetical protein
MSSNEPNAYIEGGIADADTFPQADQTKPIFKHIPYKGMTAQKAAVLVSKEVG